MILGAHISTKGGIVETNGHSPLLDRAIDLGVQAIQIHPSGPQQWAKPKITDEQASDFAREMKKRRLGPLFFHNIYLINFASQDNRIWHGSITSTSNYLRLAERMTAGGVITHLGSTKGADWKDARKRVIDGLHKVFDNLDRTGGPMYPPNLRPKFIIETAAGAGNVIGDDLDEVAEIFNAIKDDHPCGICIDTAHLFASGRPIHTQDGLDDLLQEIDQKIGLQNLVAVHLNDSMSEFNSKHDRHENIGQGKIGDEALARIINHSKLKNIPFILEVPGFEGGGPDKQNVKRVLELLKYI